MAFEIANNVKEIHGIDLSSKMIEIAERTIEEIIDRYETELTLRRHILKEIQENNSFQICATQILHYEKESAFSPFQAKSWAYIQLEL